MVDGTKQFGESSAMRQCSLILLTFIICGKPSAILWHFENIIFAHYLLYSRSCLWGPISAKHQFLFPAVIIICNYYICKVASLLPKLSAWSHKIITCSSIWRWIWSWIIITTDSINYQRIPCLQGCLGELLYIREVLQCRCEHTTTVILCKWPFGSGSKAEMSTLLKYLNRNIYM